MLPAALAFYSEAATAQEALKQWSFASEVGERSVLCGISSVIPVPLAERTCYTFWIMRAAWAVQASMFFCRRDKDVNLSCIRYSIHLFCPAYLASRCA